MNMNRILIASALMASAAECAPRLHKVRAIKRTDPARHPGRTTVGSTTAAAPATAAERQRRIQRNPRALHGLRRAV